MKNNPIKFQKNPQSVCSSDPPKTIPNVNLTISLESVALIQPTPQRTFSLKPNLAS